MTKETHPTGRNSRGVAGQDWTNAYCHLLDQQLGMLKQLESIASGLSTLIASGDADGIAQLVDERQGVIDRLTALQSDAIGFRERYDESRSPREEIASRTRAVSDIARRILEGDDRDRRALGAKRDEIARELGEVASGRRAASAYAPRVHDDARFQDQQG